jgi:hypothetical protein
MKIIKTLSDRLLKLFLPDVSAGACVPENGRCCTARNYRFNCYGTCKYSLNC